MTVPSNRAIDGQRLWASLMDMARIGATQRQVLQIARSFVPGGLGGWVIYNKSLPMAPLALTIEAETLACLLRLRDLQIVA